MSLLLLGKHYMFSLPNDNGGWNHYYRYDAMTWVLGALALASLTWVLVQRYLRARALRRRPRRTQRKLPYRTIRVKRELSSRYLAPGFSGNIHAVGIGRLAGG